ncbi:MAG TPA: hypothetical protein VLI21_14290 [Casimicrobiaceae bacterium]|nr:hypothetical protein [Casimicrobiaceae bacterium]
MTGRTLADCLKDHPNPAGRTRGNSGMSGSTSSSGMSGSNGMSSSHSNGGGNSATGDMGTKK